MNEVNATNKVVGTGPNGKAMLTQGFLGLFFGSAAGVIISAVVSAQLSLTDAAFRVIAIVIALSIATISAIRGARSRKSLGQQAGASTPTGPGLSKREFILVTLLCLFVPVLGGAVLYYYWKVSYPKKAMQANIISWIIFILYLSFIAFVSFNLN